jgi:hypothetical protein
MLREILGSEYKLFRRLQSLALERFFQGVLDEVSRLADDVGKSGHQRYLAVYKLLQERDEELAAAFDNPRRSTALVQLARIQFQGLLTDEEFAQFSDETRGLVQVFLNMWRS